MHLSELHGAATHLAVVAIPLYAIVLILHRAGIAAGVGRALSPWVLGAAIVGVVLAGVTGLLVWGQAQTELRGNDFRIGTVHLWLGIAIAVVVLATAALWWFSGHGRLHHHPPAPALLGIGALAFLMVIAQGYLGGRMTYAHGVGVQSAGEYAQTAAGASRLSVALADGVPDVQAGKAAFRADALGCASCHGDRAQGDRGPRLAGGRDLGDFRRVHAEGLFPPSVVTDRDFAAIDAWLKTLP